MSDFTVFCHVRKRGAIGIFYWTRLTVKAESFEEAKDLAMELLHKEFELNAVASEEEFLNRVCGKIIVS